MCEAGNATKRWRADENVSVRCHRAPSEMLFARRRPTCLCTYTLSYFQTFSSFSVATTPRSSLISPLPHVAEGISSPLIECDTLKALSPPFNVDLMLVKLHSDHLSCQHLPCGGAFGFILVHRVLCDRLSAFYLRNLKQFLRMEMTRMLTIQ